MFVCTNSIIWGKAAAVRWALAGVSSCLTIPSHVRQQEWVVGKTSPCCNACSSSHCSSVR